MDIHLSPTQTKAWEILDDPDVMEVLYGGAKGGGKSVLGCYWVYHRCLWLIEACNIKPSNNPVPVGFMGRKRSVNFTETTLETWRKMIPADLYRMRLSDKEIIIGESVKVDYGGLDDTEKVQKFNSAEYDFLFLDQAEEMTRTDVSVLRATRRFRYNNICPPPKGLFTANPGPSFLKEEFIDRPESFRRFVPALPGDNPWLPTGYVDILKDSFKHRPELLEAYLYGSWTALEGADQVIRDKWIRESIERKLYPDSEKRLLSCDPARFGDDETVIYEMINGDIKGEHIFGQKDTMWIANTLHTLALQKHSSVVGVDAIGIGAGIVDRLYEMCGKEYEVRAVTSSERASSDRFHNKRAEMWWEAARLLSEGDVDLNWEDPTLHTQLCTPTYKFRNTRILIEGKDEIKKRIGRSPDRADAYVQGLYLLQFTPEKNKHVVGYKGIRWNLADERRRPKGSWMSR